ncbi:unnamed protein product [Adineta steineri]|uniref:NHL repeat containing protein n=1 Tax=Adineta steineri TaxID=433720 RepID=A0A815QFD4_9BILA|nr:unnamed protein product [Adineta steineri]
MYANSTCYDLFVDNNNTLYCSMYHQHQVVKRSLNDPVGTSAHVIAGTGIAGEASYELELPWGIFVDTNLDLYVADFLNHRIQLFQYGKSNGTTVVGYETPNPTFHLSFPTTIALDAEKYLFIIDNDHERIVGSGSYGFRCLVGCYGQDSQSDQSNPLYDFSFDRFGNMFVADGVKSEIQKFQYLEESCNDSLVAKSIYKSAITSNSSTYIHHCRKSGSYYQAIQMNVTITGVYTFLIKSEMTVIFQYMHQNSFDPFNMSKNAIIYAIINNLNYLIDYRSPFQLMETLQLQANMPYVFIMTTCSPNNTGNFSIEVFGPNHVNFNRIGEYL